MKFQLYIWVMIVGMFASCIKDADVPDIPTEPEKVRLELFTRTDNYEVPAVATRTGAALEDNIDLAAYVFVFRGSGDAATFYEVVQATVAGDKAYVELTPYNGTCELVIIANPQDYFTDYGETEQEFSISALQSYFIPGAKTLGEFHYNIRTKALANPQTSVPFTGGNKLLPMACRYTVPSIHVRTQIGTSDSKLKLIRNVAKIVVANTDPSFNLLGATVINTAKRGTYINASGWMVNPAGDIGFTDYYAATGDPVTGISAAASGTDVDGNGNSGQTTASNPIYVYESTAANKMGVIIKATFSDGEDYYYKLYCVNSNKQFIDIARNYQYTFVITKVNRKGYSNLTEAVNSTVGANEDLLNYTVLVTDANSHAIVDNGSYYLGVSNTEFVFYAGSQYSSSTITGLSAFVVTTNRVGALSENSIQVVGTSGITLTNSGTTAIPLATSATILNPYEVQINVNPDLFPPGSEGQIKLVLGDLEQTVTIRHAGYAFNNGYEAEVVNFNDGTYLSALPTQDARYPNGSNLRLYFTLDGNTPADDADRKGSIMTENGSFYMHIGPGAYYYNGWYYDSGFTSTVYTTKKNGSRAKYWLVQSISWAN